MKMNLLRFIYFIIVSVMLINPGFSTVKAAMPQACLEKEPVTIVIRNDDVCSLSDPVWEKKITDLFVDRGIPHTVGFIPYMATGTRYDPDTVLHPITEKPAILDLYLPLIEQGIVDVAQHGTTHQNNKFHAGDQSPAQSSEFAGLTVIEQKDRLGKGKALLEKVFKQPMKIFIPPWNNLDQQTIMALRQLRFNAVSDTHLYRTDGLKIGMPDSRMIHFSALTETLDELAEQGQCRGELTPQTIVVLYHSWGDYSDAGVARVSKVLDVIKHSGVHAGTLSDVFHLDHKK
ncbi:MAG: DUF2334 domain-containing protein [bacterium]